MTTTCNLNCVCVDSECSYNHYISYKERKIVRNFYDAISNKSKDEPNPETRKKNCTFGQLCEKENCGFRHRLSFANREKLIVSFRFNKICPPSKPVVAKTVAAPKQTNIFLCLEDDVVEEEIIEVAPAPVVVKQPKFEKSWVSVVSAPPPVRKVNLTAETSRWEDLDDDGFYMKF